MYNEYVEQIQKKSWISNVIIPIIVAGVVLFGTALVTGVIGLLMTGASFDTIGSVDLAGAIGMFLNIVVSTFLMIKISKLSMRRMGYIKEGMFSSYLKGAIGGIVAVSIVVAANFVFGGVHITYAGFDSKIVLVSLLFFVFQGFYEEVIFRMYLMPLFSKRMGDVWAIIVTSLLFAGMHGMNPNMSVMGVVNLIIFGGVFAMVYYVTGNAWIVGAGHSFWNFFLGIIYGSHVSGTIMPGAVLNSDPVAGRNLLSGGSYGMEGSIFATVIGIGIILYCIKIKKKQKALSQAQ